MSRRGHRSRPVEAVKRPEAAEGRRLRAAELLAQGRAQVEVAEASGSHARACGAGRGGWSKGGWRRCAAAGPGPAAKLSDAQAAQVEQALRQGAKANGFTTDLWTLDRVAQLVEHRTGVGLARASTWRLLVGRLAGAGSGPTPGPRAG